MSLTKLTENLNNVSSLPDKPTLTSEELKAVFDKSGNILKDYINDTLTPEVEELVSKTAKANKIIVENVLTSDSVTNALSALQGKELKNLIDNAKTNLDGKDEELEKTINGTVLYKNDEGTSSDIELSESVTNFNKIEIYITRGDVRTFKGNNGENTIVSCQVTGDSGNLRQFFCNITFNDNKITFGKQYFKDSDGYGQEYTKIKITKVMGYK